MDKQRNIELENWLIETTGEEMMANHLGPNWNRFNEEFGVYPNISMTIADQVWEHKQKRVDEITQLYAMEQFNKKVVAKRASEKVAELQLQKDELEKRMNIALGLINTNNEDLPIKFYKSDLKKVLMFEQALKGGKDQYQETRKHAEDRINNGAKLTNHRIDL